MYEIHTFSRIYYFIYVLDDQRITGYKFMPSSNPNFVGREDHLQCLHDHFLEQSAKKSSGHRFFVLFGIGGVGKTQICLKFVEQSIDR
jgi:flagellar biosynthesis GTPase FlhF